MSPCRITASFASSVLAPFVLLLACGGAPPSAVGDDPPAAPTPAVTPQAASAEADRHYLTALELEAAGRHVEARVEVEAALAGGAGRDATLLAAKLAILRDDLEAASRLLAPLADTADAPVLYNLGLIAQRRGEYNSARSRYLAALKADPRYAAARYNLAHLTWDAGIFEEAQHHARKFIELSPDDSRVPELRTKVRLDATPAAPTPAATDTKPDTKPDTKTDAKPRKPADVDPATGLRDPFAKR